MCSPWGIDLKTHHTMSGRSIMELHLPTQFHVLLCIFIREFRALLNKIYIAVHFSITIFCFRSANMIGGLFIYNHKGEVLISRVFRDDIG